MTGWIEDIETLEALYGAAAPASLVKVADHLTPEYRAWIEAAPFCALATLGPEGLDCSPRGDEGPVVTALDVRHLALPDRRGNNRIDSLRNIVRDPRMSLMFMIPGSATIIRVNGHARLTADADYLDRFSVHGKPPRSVIVVKIAEVYFQCARAVMRAQLWEGGFADPAALPTPGQILAAQSNDFNSETYDAAWADRASQTMW